MSKPVTGDVPVATILVVDDMEANRYLAGSWLRRKGYRVVEAATGAEALETLAAEQPNLVLLDVHLPDVSGFEVCARIKADPETAAIPVIHMSATAIEPDDRTDGLNHGADGYVVEPVDPAELIAVVESALRYHRARSDAEHLAGRLTKLTEATLAINSATTFDDFLTAVAGGAAAIFEVPAAALTTTPLGVPRVANVSGGETSVGAGAESALDDLIDVGFPPEARTVIRDGQRPGWRAGRSSTIVLSRFKVDAPTICIAVDEAVATTEQARNLLIQLGQVAALAANAMRTLNEERNLAVTLQRSLLPRRLPSNSRLPMTARYQPASNHAEIGGDFYEVTDLDGRLLIAVGDVCGHSIKAATVMGEVRHALRAYAAEGHGLVQILDRLDAMLMRFHPDGLTTACLMLVDPESGAAEVACAGHIPPLVADHTGTRYLDVSGPLLGAGIARPESTKFDLPLGSLTLLVTDGLLERRGVDIDDGLAALAATVTSDADLDTLCDKLLEEFGHDAEDDIAVLSFRRR